jgi:predicted ATP-binding protein involved in virulence
MQIKRLRLSAFRSLEEVTLTFSQITVLTGSNGSGKSSVLDCLAILLSYLNDIEIYLTPLTDPESTYSAYRRASANHETLLRGRVFDPDDIHWGSNRALCEIGIFFNFREINWSLTKVSGQETTLTNSEQVREMIDDIRYLHQMKPNLNLPLTIYYPVHRSLLSIPLDLPTPGQEQVDAYHEVLTGKQFPYGSFFRWFRLLEDLENEDRRDHPDYRDPKLEAVRTAVSQVAPGFSDLRVRRMPLRMTVMRAGREVLVSRLSEGERGLIALAGDLAWRLGVANPGVVDPLQASGVVLIDEVELFLHPQWQRQILPSLQHTFPNCQFIVTTHATAVLESVSPGQIIELSL